MVIFPPSPCPPVLWGPFRSPQISATCPTCFCSVKSFVDICTPLELSVCSSVYPSRSLALFKARNRSSQIKHKWPEQPGSQPFICTDISHIPQRFCTWAIDCHRGSITWWEDYDTSLSPSTASWIPLAFFWIFAKVQLKSSWSQFG